MKVGDLIQHRTSKKLAIIVEEIGPYDKKPYYYYNLLWIEKDERTVAPLNVLLKLWENISENPRNLDI
tara:strand:+ start:221 stop:424 length:204 start_codon:yes stop_codon:yes gene_type:complete